VVYQGKKEKKKKRKKKKPKKKKKKKKKKEHAGVLDLRNSAIMRNGRRSQITQMSPRLVP